MGYAVRVDVAVPSTVFQRLCLSGHIWVVDIRGTHLSLLCAAVGPAWRGRSKLHCPSCVRFWLRRGLPATPKWRFHLLFRKCECSGSQSHPKGVCSRLFSLSREICGYFTTDRGNCSTESKDVVIWPQLARCFFRWQGRHIHSIALGLG